MSFEVLCLDFPSFHLVGGELCEECCILGFSPHLPFHPLECHLCKCSAKWLCECTHVSAIEQVGKCYWGLLYVVVVDHCVGVCHIGLVAHDVDHRAVQVVELLLVAVRCRVPTSSIHLRDNVRRGLR